MLAIKTSLSMPCFSGFLKAMSSKSELNAPLGDIGILDVPRMSPRFQTIPEHKGLTRVKYN
jgi:hypothetical protein